MLSAQVLMGKLLFSTLNAERFFSYNARTIYKSHYYSMDSLLFAKKLFFFKHKVKNKMFRGFQWIWRGNRHKNIILLSYNDYPWLVRMITWHWLWRNVHIEKTKDGGQLSNLWFGIKISRTLKKVFHNLKSSFEKDKLKFYCNVPLIKFFKKVYSGY